jgi:hypothetical protein
VIVGGADNRRLVQTIRLAATKSGSSESFSLKKTFIFTGIRFVALREPVAIKSLVF